MKEQIMLCDCCGKRFYSEYYTEGYIDHCVNFSDRFGIIIRKDVADIFRDICFDGNTLRDMRDVKVRLNCFEKYCDVKEEHDKFQKVKAVVDSHIEKLFSLNSVHDAIGALVKDLNEDERAYIGLKYQAFLCDWGV